jgi:molybdenum cofactor cytidylyltransferase
MGSPKALLDYRGETFIHRLLRVLSGVCDPVIVVLGYHAEALRPAVADATIVVNPAPERGQLSSLQSGLAALPPGAEGFLFTPVDSPAVEIATVELLAAAFRHRDPAIQLVIPRYQGKRGHPVFATRAIAKELNALPLTAQAREVIHGHVDDTLYMDVDDPGILTDIDDREAYRRLSEAAP